jgi:hypothetical protein
VGLYWDKKREKLLQQKHEKMELSRGDDKTDILDKTFLNINASS